MHYALILHSRENPPTPLKEIALGRTKQNINMDAGNCMCIMIMWRSISNTINGDVRKK